MAHPTRTPPSRYRLEISEHVDEVVLRAISPDREERFESARAFIDGLRAAVQDQADAWHMQSLLEEDTWCRLARSRPQ